MESISSVKMIELPDDVLLEVRKEFDLHKQGAMKEAVDVFEDWVRKQNHFLKRDFERGFLERLIILAKGSVEKAKARLDKLCTWKTLNPRFFQDVDIEVEFAYLFDLLTHVICPKLTDQYERVCITKMHGSGFTTKNCFDGYRMSIMLAEYALAHDYAKGHHIILDLRTANVSNAIMNFSFLDFRDTILLMIDGYGVRVKGVHLISDSQWTRWMDTVFSIGKQVSSPKIRDRIFIHKSLETLHEKVQKDVFPEDYGGKEKPLAEMRADWVKVLNSDKFRDYWRQMCAAKTEESLRQNDNFNNQYMGMPGTFRTLSVD